MQKPVFLIFANNSRSKQNEKHIANFFVDIGKQGMCAKFQQEILNCRVIGARQFFTIFDTKYLVSRQQQSFVSIFVSDFALLNQYYQIIIKSVHKKNYFNHVSHLNYIEIVLKQQGVSIKCHGGYFIQKRIENLV